MQRLLLAGMSHKTAPLALRERFTLSRAQRAAAIQRFRALYPECEIVVLSTCNRVEIYIAREVHGHPRMAELVGFLQTCGIEPNKPADLASVVHTETQFGVAEHLFAVAAGVESMVVGETQIIGQVREAYEEACNLGSAGPMLNPLFQRAIAAGKAATTAIAHRGDAPSIASAAMHLVRQTAGPLGAKSVLSIGAGDVSRQVLNYLRAIGPARLLISNRTDETARALAREYSGETVDFSRLAEGIALADVVVTSTSSRRPIVGLRHFERSTVTVQPPKLLMDLGVPRDIEPVVRSLPGILLHDLDDLGNTVSGSTRQSTGSSSAAEAILREHLHDYAAWQRARDFGPTIASLYDRYHVLAEEELQRAIAGMSMQSPADVARLRGFAERMVNKLLHDPVQSLREADSLQSPAHNYAEVLRKLFKLPTPPEEEI